MGKHVYFRGEPNETGIGTVIVHAKCFPREPSDGVKNA